MRPAGHIKLPRTFLAWSRPGQKELDRVELIPGRNIHDPEPFHGRTAEEITIPQGMILKFVVENDDPLELT